MMNFDIAFTAEAREDIKRLHDFMADIDLAAASRAIDLIFSGFDVLTRHPHICRRAQDESLGPLWRELLINFGSSGYIALFEITDENTVTIATVRHQRESDYH
jgi:plasmid stabilization system protein ParE